MQKGGIRFITIIRNAVAALLIGCICILLLSSDLPKPGYLKDRTIYHYNRLETDSVLLYAVPLFTYYMENQMYDSLWGIMKYHVRALSKVEGIEVSTPVFKLYERIFNECYSGNTYIQSQLLDEEGMLLLEEFRIDEAQEILQRSLQMRQKILHPQDTFLAISHALIAESYCYESEYVLAEAEIEKAIRIRSQTSDPDDRMMGVYYLLRAGTRYDRFDETEADILRAISIFKLHLGDDFKGLNICYNNLSNLYYDGGQIEKAIETLMLSIRNHEKDPVKNRNSLAINFANLSRFYWGLGDREHAFYYCNKSMSLFEQNPEAESYYLQNLYDQAGGYYQAMGYYDLSETYFEKGRKIKEAIFGTNSIPYAQYLYNIGRSKSYKYEMDEALEYYQKSADIRGELMGTDHPLYADCLSDMADCYRILGQYPKSLDYYRRSSEIYSVNYGLYHGHHISDKSNVAYLLTLMGKNEEALAVLQQCLELSTQGKWVPDNSLQNPPIEILKYNYSLNTILLSKHSILRTLGAQKNDIAYLLSAYELLKMCTSEVNRFYFELEGLKNRKDLISDLSEVYSHKADLAFQLYEMTSDSSYLDDIFEYSESSKGFNLRDLIRSDKAAKFAGVPDSMIIREKQLTHKIHLFMENEYEADNEEFKLKILSWQEELDSLKQTFKNSYPQYAEIRYDLNTISRKQAQQTLQDDACSIILMKGKQQYYRIFLTKTSYEVEKCGHVSMLEGCYDDMFKAMEKNQAAKFDIASNYLYRCFFEKIEPHLKGQINWIPDAYFHQLNPEILTKTVSPTTSAVSFESLDYLLNQYEILLNHSVVLMQNWNEYAGQKKSSIPILGISPFGADAEENQICDHENKQLIRLPWSEKTLEELDQHFSGKFLSGKEATKPELLHYLPESSILHFGTHAITDNDEPMKSGLVLACDKENPDWTGRTLSAAELFAIQLNSKLAVLTACQTGKGKYESGEGVISLARAFNYAGCPSLIMTLWSVDDQATSEIILDFYTVLHKQQPLSTALHVAKRNYLSAHNGELANPIYWAGMVMIGQNQILLLEDKPFILSYFPVLGLSILLLFAVFYLIRRKKLRS